jgi:hypothetical protein
MYIFASAQQSSKAEADAEGFNERYTVNHISLCRYFAKGDDLSNYGQLEC